MPSDARPLRSWTHPSAPSGLRGAGIVRGDRTPQAPRRARRNPRRFHSGLANLMSVKLTIQRASSVRHNSSSVRRKNDSRTAAVTAHPNCATFLDSPAGPESLWRIEIGGGRSRPDEDEVDRRQSGSSVGRCSSPAQLRRGPPDDQRTRLGRATHVAPVWALSRLMA
jgi:hypothetical protein